MSELVSALNKADELLEVEHYLNDPNVEEVFDYIAKLAVNPIVPHEKIGGLIVRLQAMGAEFHVKKTYYMHLAALDEELDKNVRLKKKNVYASLTEIVNDLVNALKYMYR